MISVRSEFIKLGGGVGAGIAAIALWTAAASLNTATAQSQFPPLQNQQGGAQPDPGQSGAPGGFPQQQAPYPGQQGGQPGQFSNQRPYPGQQGGQQGQFSNQPPFPPQDGPPGGFASQPPFPQQGRPPGNFSGRQPFPQQQPGSPGGFPNEPGFPPPAAGAPTGNMPPGGMQAGRPQRPGSSSSQLGSRLDALMRQERQDFGVRATSTLHRGPMHGPTPNRIPGGQLITTKGLYALMNRRDIPHYIFDVLGSNERLPRAIPAVPAAAAGNFRDRTQQMLSQFLSQVTRQNRQAALVFYCQGVQCWMSYNAALRAINLGYRNVLWYRGGIAAWKSAGLPVQPANRTAQRPSRPQQPYRR